MPDDANQFAPKRLTPPSRLAGLCRKAVLPLDDRRGAALLASAHARRAVLG